MMVSSENGGASSIVSNLLLQRLSLWSCSCSLLSVVYACPIMALTVQCKDSFMMYMIFCKWFIALEGTITYKRVKRVRAFVHIFFSAFKKWRWPFFSRNLAFFSINGLRTLTSVNIIQHPLKPGSHCAITCDNFEVPKWNILWCSRKNFLNSLEWYLNRTVFFL